MVPDDNLGIFLRKSIIEHLSHRQTVKAQASLHICAVSPEPSLFTL